MDTNHFDTLLKTARADRVGNTGFLEADEAAQLVSRLRQADVSVHVSGGFPGAKRRIVTVFPEHIPEADTPVKVFYINDEDESAVRVGLTTHVPKEAIGDGIKHQEGVSFILLAKAAKGLPDEIRVSGRMTAIEEIPLERIMTGSRKRQMVIVPSLRVDALGAKAFNVSRSYFAKGIKAGNVTINGHKAEKSSNAEPGDEIYADTIGRMYVASVQGETRRGNLKVIIDIEK